MDTGSRKIFFSLLIVCLMPDVLSLQITKLSVPPRVALGDSARLECDWSNNDRKIYSLKWYYGLKEFYRWTPAERDSPIQVFDVPDFRVDKQESDRGSVVLRNFSRSEGIMRCEISDEAPSFHTAAKTQVLEVVETPSVAPTLEPVYHSYQLGQEVAINCTSRHSKPPAKLTFYLNDEPVNPVLISRNFTEKDGHNNGFPLFKSTQEIRFRVRERILRRRDGRIAVKCVAEIPGVYYQTNEATLSLDRPYSSSIMEGRASAAVVPCIQPLLSLTALLLVWSSYSSRH